MKIQRVHCSEQRDTSSRWEKLIDKRNSIRVKQSEKPQHRDQSKRVHWHKSNNWTTVFPLSSKERRFCSIQIVHIKQPGIKSKYRSYASQATGTNKKISPLLNLAWPNQSQTTEAYKSIKNELSNKKVTGDPQIPHYNNTYNNDSPKGDHKA